MCCFLMCFWDAIQLPRLEDTEPKGRELSTGFRVRARTRGSRRSRQLTFVRVDFPQRLSSCFLLAACFFAVAKNWAGTHSIAVDIDSSSVRRRVTRRSKTIKRQSNRVRTLHGIPSTTHAKNRRFIRGTNAGISADENTRTNTKSKSRIPDRKIPTQDTDTTVALVFILAIIFFNSQSITACRSA